MNQRFRTAIVGGAVATAALVFAPIAYVSAQTQTPTQQTSPRPGMHRWGHGGFPLISFALKHQTELNLSSDQVANLEKIRSNFQAQVTPIFQQLRGIEQQIRTL